MKNILQIEIESKKLSGVFMVKEHKLSSWLKKILKKHSPLLKLKIWN